MTVASNKTALKRITGSGWSNPLSHDMLLEDSTYLEVWADDVQLAAGTDYSVSGVGSEVGYEVTILTPGDWDPTLWTLMVRTPVGQPTSLAAGGTLGAVYEAALDKIGRRLKTLEGDLSRAILRSIDKTSIPVVDGAFDEGDTLKIDASGNIVAGPSATDIAEAGTYAAAAAASAAAAAIDAAAAAGDAATATAAVATVAAYASAASDAADAAAASAVASASSAGTATSKATEASGYADDAAASAAAAIVAKMEWQSDWLTATDYALNDVVFNDGTSFICTVAHTSDAPSEPGAGASWTTYWDYVAKKGLQGDPGTDGADGSITSVGLAVPTGFSVAGSPITVNGTITVSYAAGYKGYTTAEATKIGYLTVTGATNLDTIRGYLDQSVKTTDSPTFAKPTVKAVKETGYNLVGTVIDPANGGIQYKTLSANTTFTESLADGDSVTLLIDDGSAYTITWPTITWRNNGGVAPTLATTGYTVIEIFKVNGTLYGLLVGDGS